MTDLLPSRRSPWNCACCDPWLLTRQRLHVIKALSALKPHFPRFLSPFYSSLTIGFFLFVALVEACYYESVTRKMSSGLTRILLKMNWLLGLNSSLSAWSVSLFFEPVFPKSRCGRSSRLIVKFYFVTPVLSFFNVLGCGSCRFRRFRSTKMTSSHYQQLWRLSPQIGVLVFKRWSFDVHAVHARKLISTDFIAFCCHFVFVKPRFQLVLFHRIDW